MPPPTTAYQSLTKKLASLRVNQLKPQQHPTRVLCKAGAHDVVPWSGRSGTSYSQMEIIEGRKLVSHKAVFVRFPLVDRENEYILVWTTTPWTLTSNVIAAVNANINYVKVKASDGSIYYFAEENLNFKRLEKQFKEKKQWIDGVPKLKTIAQIFNERGGFEVLETIKGRELVGMKYTGTYCLLYTSDAADE